MTGDSRRSTAFFLDPPVTSGRERVAAHYRAHGAVFASEYEFPELQNVRIECDRVDPVPTFRIIRSAYRELPRPAKRDWIFGGTAGVSFARGPYGLILHSYCGAVCWVPDRQNDNDHSETRTESLGSVDTLVVARPSSISTTRFNHTLLHAFLPQFLALRGALMLHAACVVISDRAHLFAGASGIGKSTLATGFAQHGFRVLAEDVVRVERQVDGTVIAFPGYPGSRLRSSNFLLDPLRSVKRGGRFGLPKHRVEWINVVREIEPVVVGSLCFLGRSRQVRPTFEAVSPPLSVSQVLKSTFMQALPESLRAREGFQRSVDLVRSVPCCSLRYCRSPSHFADLIRDIAANVVGK